MHWLNNYCVATSTLPTPMIEQIAKFMADLDEFASHFGHAKGLLESVLQQLLDGHANGDLMRRELHKFLDYTQSEGYSMSKDDAAKLMMLIILTALHLAVHALQASTVEDAVRALAEAHQLRGFADGVLYAGNDALVRADLAREAVKARHAETNAMKERLIEWYAANPKRFKSVDAAAQEAIKLEPIAFTTARKWITEYRKAVKLQ